MKHSKTIPRATYRLQLNRNFTFAQATEIVPYLDALGISHCYISPCLKARAGSLHGYDIVDHNSLNPEIGSAEDFDRFVSVLHEHGMGLILDIVPNHMGIMGSDNAWWLDVLENGQSSIYASFFDIDWRPLKDELHGKVLVPVLGDHYGAVLEKGELKLDFHADRGALNILYNTHCFPIDPREYPRVLQHCTTGPTALYGEQNPDLLEFESLVTAFGHLPDRHEVTTDRIAERNRDKEVLKRRLAELCGRAPEVTARIQRVVNTINGDPSNPDSYEQLHELIKAQAFRLANWRVASDDINYRRFFDTNDLAGIRTENKFVFEETHRLILRLMADGKVDGLRIDHPDGLYDPAQYFDRLYRRISALKDTADEESDKNLRDDSPKPHQCPRFVVIEKILTGSERLPGAWNVCGTTGYDFANLVNNLFINPDSIGRMDRTYRKFTEEDTDFDALAYRCRMLIVRVSLASELNVLANHLVDIALAKRRTCDFTLNSLRDALAEVLASFPVYRTYITPSQRSENDERYIRIAIAVAKWRSPAADNSVFDFLAEVLLTRIAEGQDDKYQNAVMAFAMKFQQFSGPVMAKGLEDTAFYRYNRLVSLNEVGSDLHRFGITPADFHLANQNRPEAWPHTMLATSTHDSKRSEDVRARINVLSEMPGPWRLRVRNWRRSNSVHKTIVNAKPAPSANDEYLLYQTLLGVWPRGDNDFDERERNIFSDRVSNYMLKALREAKQNTSWINQNKEYENAVLSFVKALLTPDENNSFLRDFLPFQRRAARMGVWTSLSQTLLKLTCPGVPDIYQGNELLDFSLVDPDNRRPVDYQLRQHTLQAMQATVDHDDSHLTRMLQTPENGQAKMYIIWKTLGLRQQRPELFRSGEYLPITVEGDKAAHVIAFARRSGDSTLIIIVPRLIAGLLPGLDTPPLGQVWQDTRVVLPFCACGANFRNAFTGETLTVDGPIKISNTLSSFPVALFVSE